MQMLTLNRREVGVLVAGLVVGLLVGMALIGFSDSTRERLFGSALESDDGDTDDEAGPLSPVDPYAYYLADMSQAQVWLNEQSAESDPDFQTVFTVLGTPLNPNFDAQFRAQLPTIQRLVPAFHTTLAGQVAAGSVVETCMALENDPTSSAPNLYFLVTVAQDGSGDPGLPAGWRQVDESPRGSLYWQMLACQPDAGS